jgi:hypothetical protein
MPKSTSGFNPAEYTTVAERITLFRAAFPLGRIQTYLYSRDDGEIIFCAEAYRHHDDELPAATGWASERVGDGEINVSSCLENTETSAVGRALANLGFGTARHRASFEEMLSAARRRAAAAPVRLVREGAERGGHPSGRDRRAPVPAPPRRHDSAAEDVRGLLKEAIRLGLPAVKVRAHQLLLGGRSVPPSVVSRVERELREFLDERVPVPPVGPAGAPVPEPV